MKRLIIVTVLSSFLTTGCVPLLVGTAVYGVSKKRQQQNEQQAEYSHYLLKMQKLNMERETKGLEPVEILDRRDWESTTK